MTPIAETATAMAPISAQVETSQSQDIDTSDYTGDENECGYGYEVVDVVTTISRDEEEEWDHVERPVYHSDEDEDDMDHSGWLCVNRKSETQPHTPSGDQAWWVRKEENPAPEISTMRRTTTLTSTTTAPTSLASPEELECLSRRRCGLIGLLEMIRKPRIDNHGDGNNKDDHDGNDISRFDAQYESLSLAISQAAKRAEEESAKRAVELKAAAEEKAAMEKTTTAAAAKMKMKMAKCGGPFIFGSRPQMSNYVSLMHGEGRMAQLSACAASRLAQNARLTEKEKRLTPTPTTTPTPTANSSSSSSSFHPSPSSSSRGFAPIYPPRPPPYGDPYLGRQWKDYETLEDFC